MLKARQQQYKQLFDQISSGLNTEIRDWLSGNATIAQAGQKMYQDLVFSMLDYFEKKAEKKLEDWLLDQIFGRKKGIQNEAEANSNVGVAATEALASVPWPFNIEAAAETESVGLGYVAQTSVGVYEKGGYVPMTGLALLHEGERVIPASMSGKGDGLGMGITVVVNHSVNAVDAGSFQAHIRRHSNMIANEVTRALKRKGVR
jgi:hypothetical protein